MDEFDLFEGLTEETTPTDETSSEPTESAAEPTAEPTETPAQSDAARTEPDTQPQVAETISFKHHETTANLDKASVDTLAKALGIDANSLVSTIQKGYDYDKKNTKLSDLENRLDEYGKRLNMDRDGLFGMLENAGDRAALRSIAAVVQAEHPDWNAEAVQEISKARLAEQKRQNAETAAAQEQQKKEEELRPFQQFFMRHTDITPDTMPDEMKTDIFERGFTPEEAYQKYQNTQKDKEIETIKAQLAQMQKDAENRAKSIGSVTSEVGGKTEDDAMADFLYAFR